jgi:hypothetical protein
MRLNREAHRKMVEQYPLVFREIPDEDQLEYVSKAYWAKTTLVDLVECSYVCDQLGEIYVVATECIEEM